jgi:hypothetical protein
MHPAIQEELEMLRERFPGKNELTFVEYAEYFGISRKFAPQHFARINRGPDKIGHKKIGRKTIIPFLDFAFWLANKKVVDGGRLPLTWDDAKRQRGVLKRTYTYGRGA